MAINVRDYLGGSNVPDPYNTAQSEADLLRQQQIERDQYLNQISGRAPAYSQDALESLRIAGNNRTAGGVILAPGAGGFKLARDAIGISQREQDIFDATDKKRAQNVDSDADRVREYVRASISQQGDKDKLDMRGKEHELATQRLSFDLDRSKSELAMKQEIHGLNVQKQELSVEESRAKANGLTRIEGLKTKDGKFIYTNAQGLPVTSDLSLVTRDNTVRDRELDTSNTALGRQSYGTYFRGSDGHLYRENRSTALGGGSVWEDENGNEKPESVTLDRLQDTTQSGAPKPASGGKLTNANYLSAGFGDRMALAESDYQNVVGSGFDPTSKQQAFDETIAGMLPDQYAGFMRGDQGASYHQAMQNWVTANLRKESGAAIPEIEMQREIEKYFPMPGNSAQVVAQKERSRRQAYVSMKNSSAGAWVGDQPNPYDPGDNLPVITTKEQLNALNPGDRFIYNGRRRTKK